MSTPESPERRGRDIYRPFQWRLRDAGFPRLAGTAGAQGSALQTATRVENACATGTAAIYQGLKAIAANQAHRAVRRCRENDRTEWRRHRRGLDQSELLQGRGRRERLVRRYLRSHRRKLSRNTAINRMPWRRSRRRTTPTARSTRLPISRRTWDMRSAVNRQIRTR